MKRNGESLVKNAGDFARLYGGSVLLVIDCLDPRLDGPLGGKWETQLVFTTEDDAFEHAKRFIRSKDDWAILRSNVYRPCEVGETKWPRTIARPWHYRPEIEGQLLPQVAHSLRQLAIDAVRESAELPDIWDTTDERPAMSVRPEGIIEAAGRERIKLQRLDHTLKLVRRFT